MTISKAAQDVAPSLSTSNMLNCKKMKKMTELSTIELKTPDRTPKIFDLRDSVKLNIKK